MRRIVKLGDPVLRRVADEVSACAAISKTSTRMGIASHDTVAGNHSGLQNSTGIAGALGEESGGPLEGTGERIGERRKRVEEEEEEEEEPEGGQKERGRAERIEITADIQRLAGDLVCTAKEQRASGVAAPQIGESLRAFAMMHRDEPWSDNVRYDVCINPQIEVRSDHLEHGPEGCLSIPGIIGLVPRHKTIRVSYYNESGFLKRPILTDYVARVFQHELDHLDGIVWLDRITSNRDIFSEEHFNSME